jgi:dolichol-phosphate mannosyltransferase
MDPVLTVIMCAYNEMSRIREAFDDVLGSMADRPEPVEIIVLDNGSTDGTREWLRDFRHPAVRVELNERNLGKGGSVKKGLRLSRGAWVVVHDPDLEYRARDLWTLLDLARTTGASLVLGSRYLGKGRAERQTLANYLGARALSGLIRLLYGCRITDAATAMKLMDGATARGLQLVRDGFELDFEIVARVARAGGLIAEAPIAYHPRTRAEGKKVQAGRDGLRALGVIVRARLDAVPGPQAAPARVTARAADARAPRLASERARRPATAAGQR